MKSQPQMWVLVLWTLALGNLPGVQSQAVCGYYEEGTGKSLTCSTKTSPFSRYGPRVEIDGTFEEMSYCDSNGNCTNNDDTRYTASFIHNPETGRRNVTLHINEVNRNMTRVMCYIDGNPLFGVVCSLYIYITPSKPTCSVPEFVDGGSAVLITCTSDRAYPDPVCGLGVKAGSRTFEDNHRLSVSDTLTSSERYPGDKELTCRFRMQLTGIAENVYTFQVQFHEHLPVYQPTIVQADTIPALDLRATALDSPGDTVHRVTIDRDTRELKVNIPVFSNPPPTHFSLSVRHDETSASVSVSGQYYSAKYKKSADDGLRGTIEVTVATDEVMGEQRSAFFTFTADNRVVGSKPFEAMFSWSEGPPTQPVCEKPRVVDGGASVTITCTSDRVTTSRSSCDVTVTNTSSELGAGWGHQYFSSEDSTAFPGYKKGTCVVKMRVNREAGDYQFMVTINAEDETGSLDGYSVQTLTPIVTLKPLELYNSEDNGHTFKYPVSGELTVDVHLTGNPGPNRVALWARHGDTAQSVPVSSRDFRWTYAYTGSETGLILLTVQGGLERGAISTYTLKVDNGVLGGSGSGSQLELEYTFTVDDSNPDVISEKSSDNNLPMFVGAAAGGLVVIGLIIVVVAVVLMRRKRAAQSSGSDYDTPVADGGFDPAFIYPNMGYTPDGKTNDDPPGYSELPSPYLIPVEEERPVSNYSAAEYCDIYDVPPPATAST